MVYIGRHAAAVQAVGTWLMLFACLSGNECPGFGQEHALARSIAIRMWLAFIRKEMLN
jgi:hypothetical protein